MAPPTTAEFQQSRIERAVEQRGDYTFHETPEGWLCVKRDGTFYRVSETECECGDWIYRCSQNGARCKHQINLTLHKLLGRQAPENSGGTPERMGK